MQRTIQTAQDLPYPKLTWKSLDELDAGVCDGMTYEEIEVQYQFAVGAAHSTDECAISETIPGRLR